MFKKFCWFLVLLALQSLVGSVEHRLVYPNDRQTSSKESSEESHENMIVRNEHPWHKNTQQEFMHHNDVITFDENSRNANEGTSNWRDTNRDYLKSESTAFSSSFVERDRSAEQRHFRRPHGFSSELSTEERHLGLTSNENSNMHEGRKNSRSKNRRGQRLCEKKYMEYMTRIFHDDDTVADGSDSDFNGRVLAEPGQYPHMTAIGFTSANQPVDYKCGGSLISENFVITAAHCTNFTGQQPTKVRIGDLNLMVEEQYLEPQIRNVRRIINHPNYQQNLYYNDIALLELDAEVEFTEFVRPIRLWTDMNLPANTVAHAMGYGATAFGKAPTKRLTDMNITIVSNEDCNNELPEMPEAPSGVISSQICAKDYLLNRDTCQGDSGGPLQLNLRGRRRRNKQHYHLIGVTSYGLFCRSNYPSIYTRVTSFLDWIEDVVWNSQ